MIWRRFDRGLEAELRHWAFAAAGWPKGELGNVTNLDRRRGQWCVMRSRNRPMRHLRHQASLTYREQW